MLKYSWATNPRGAQYVGLPVSNLPTVGPAARALNASHVGHGLE
jgi:hypothetical protein